MDTPTGAGTSSLRTLGSFERFFWLYDQSSPLHFVVAASVEGPTQPEDWRSALDAVQRRHPFFAVGVAAAPGAAPSFDALAPRPLDLRVVAGLADGDWEAQAAQELTRPFAAGDPLVRAVLLHETGRAVLLLVAHHCAADGRSLAYAVRDTLRVLDGQALDSLPPVASQERLFGLEATPAPAGAGAAVTRRNVPTPSLHTAALSEEATRALRDRARAEGTTVHAALMAALVRAGRQAWAPWREQAVRVLTPIDTRGLAGAGEGCALLITGGLVPVATDGAPAFWDLARAVKGELAGARTREGVVGFLGMIDGAVRGGLDAAGAAQLMEQGLAYELLLTNLGDMPLGTQFGRLTLQALWGPAVLTGAAGAQTVGVATVQGRLRMLHSSYVPLPGLVDGAAQQLMAACR